MLRELRRIFFGPVRIRRSTRAGMIVDINAGSPDRAVQCLQDILDRPAAYNIITGYPLRPIRASIYGSDRKMHIIAEAGMPGSGRTIRIIIRGVSVGYKGSAGAASAAAILVMLGVSEEWENLNNTLSTPNRGRNHADGWKSAYKFKLST
jgi:hypothetical protein